MLGEIRIKLAWARTYRLVRLQQANAGEVLQNFI